MSLISPSAQHTAERRISACSGSREAPQNEPTLGRGSSLPRLRPQPLIGAASLPAAAPQRDRVERRPQTPAETTPLAQVAAARPSPGPRTPPRRRRTAPSAAKTPSSASRDSDSPPGDAITRACSGRVACSLTGNAQVTGVVDQLGPPAGDAVRGPSSPATRATTDALRERHDQRGAASSDSHGSRPYAGPAARDRSGPAPWSGRGQRAAVAARRADVGAGGGCGHGRHQGGPHRGPAHERLRGQGPPAAVQDTQLHPGVDVRATNLAVSRHARPPPPPARVRRPGWPAWPWRRRTARHRPPGCGRAGTRRRRDRGPDRPCTAARRETHRRCSDPGRAGSRRGRRPCASAGSTRSARPAGRRRAGAAPPRAAWVPPTRGSRHRPRTAGTTEVNS